jgi:hypothetical protein
MGLGMGMLGPAGITIRPVGGHPWTGLTASKGMAARRASLLPMK